MTLIGRGHNYFVLNTQSLKLPFKKSSKEIIVFQSSFIELTFGFTIVEKFK